MKEEEKKDICDIYYIKVPTFRRTIEIHIGWDKKYFDKFFWKYGYDYNLTTWFYCFDDNDNCNIIRLKDYDLETLVHELFHCTIWILDQIWEDRANWETPAYIYEEMFTRIWKKCWKRFNLSKDAEEYYD